MEDGALHYCISGGKEEEEEEGPSTVASPLSESFLDAGIIKSAEERDVVELEVEEVLVVESTDADSILRSGYSCSRLQIW